MELREKEREKKRERKTKTTMMKKRRMVANRSNGGTAKPRVENVDDEALPTLDDVVDTQHVLSHDMLIFSTAIRSML